MMPVITLLLDVSVAALLLAVILYCGRLNRNIRVLQDSKSEMAKLFSEFDQSIEAAQESVRELKEATRKSENILREKLETANSIADDLAFMIERGNKTADQIEAGLKGGRNAAKETPTAANIAPREAVNRETETPKPSFAGNPRKEVSNAPRTASIESVLEQMANRNNPAGNKPGEGKPHSRIRSKAEQELFDSLKSSR